MARSQLSQKGEVPPTDAKLALLVVFSVVPGFEFPIGKPTHVIVGKPETSRGSGVRIWTGQEPSAHYCLQVLWRRINAPRRASLIYQVGVTGLRLGH